MDVCILKVEKHGPQNICLINNTDNKLNCSDSGDIYPEDDGERPQQDPG
jgi:hypothetical protein